MLEIKTSFNKILAKLSDEWQLEDNLEFDENLKNRLDSLYNDVVFTREDSAESNSEPLLPKEELVTEQIGETPGTSALNDVLESDITASQQALAHVDSGNGTQDETFVSIENRAASNLETFNDMIEKQEEAVSSRTRQKLNKSS